MTYTLYRIYDTGGELLYVGQTNDEASRIAEHVAGSSWLPGTFLISTERGFHTRGEVEDAERAAIENEHPRFNVEGRIRPYRGWAKVPITGRKHHQPAIKGVVAEPTPNYTPRDKILVTMASDPGSFGVSQWVAKSAQRGKLSGRKYVDHAKAFRKLTNDGLVREVGLVDRITPNGKKAGVTTVFAISNQGYAEALHVQIAPWLSKPVINDALTAVTDCP